MSSTDRTVTFLFTDIVGSTRFWEICPEEMRHALSIHDEVLRAIIASHGGHLFKTTGDGIYAAFELAGPAVRAAVAIQKKVCDIDWEMPFPFRLRAVLHTGEAMFRKQDYFGLTLSRTARILEISHGEQIICSDTTAELLRDELPGDVSLVSLGLVRLKSLQRPESIFQINAPGLTTDFPPLRSLETYVHNLPIYLTTFIGREKEVSDIGRLLKANRLVTITGPGGSGKTRIALQAAANAVDEFDRGVWMVELDGVSDPALVPAAVAKVLGVREEPGFDLITSIVRSYHGGNVLILLDNCEHLVDAAASIVHRITSSCPNVKLLVTSRERLQVPGEVTVRINTMSLPPKNANIIASELVGFDSARLFVERATAVKPEFALTDSNAPDLVKIINSLDGIPLALELAAARVTLLSLDQLADRISDRFRLLSSGSRSLAARQRTLEAAIDWSYDLLTEAESLLFTRLTVFTGGWTLEAAEGICSGHGIEADAVIDLLQALVDKSLVSVEESGATRYRLLESLRSYGLAKQRASDIVELKSRHTQWYVQTVRELKEATKDLSQTSFLKMIDSEIDNVRAAIDFSRSCNPAACMELSYRLYPYWHYRGYLSEGINLIAAAVQKADEFYAGGSNREIESHKEMSLGNMAILQWAISDFKGADRSFQRAMQICREIGDESGMASNQNNLALLATSRGQYELADEMNNLALTYYRSVNDTMRAAASLSGLGSSALNQGKLDLAESYYLEARQLFEDFNDRGALAAVYCNMSDIYYWRKDYQTGVDLAKKGMVIAVAIGEKHRQIALLESLAACEVGLGCFDIGLQQLAASDAARDEHRCKRRVTSRDSVFNCAVAIAKAAVDDEEFARNVRAGRGLTLDQAVRLTNLDEKMILQPISSEDLAAAIA